MVTREQHGYKFEIEIMLPGGRVATGPLNGQKPVCITFKLADGEWERFRADHSDRSERECRQLLDAIRKDLITRCGREGIRPGESARPAGRGPRQGADPLAGVVEDYS